MRQEGPARPPGTGAEAEDGSGAGSARRIFQEFALFEILKKRNPSNALLMLGKRNYMVKHHYWVMILMHSQRSQWS
ncbi:hypothetical protein Zm00014a_031449 [Zea mays]|uniref:Uncharacterized protein n=1 Tax=Zea mays TaxID=4577 RepID=A0A3L6F537_MAIZE|nr:hypothetical protein Zm00014a_031449 [Zea mays]